MEGQQALALELCQTRMLMTHSTSTERSGVASTTTLCPEHKLQLLPSFRRPDSSFEWGICLTGHLIPRITVQMSCCGNRYPKYQHCIETRCAHKKCPQQEDLANALRNPMPHEIPENFAHV